MKKVIGGTELIKNLMFLNKQSESDFVEYNLGKRKTVIIFSPKLIYNILVKNEKNLSRGLVFLKMKNFFGNGLVVSEEPDHMHNKRIIQKDLHINRLQNYIETIYFCAIDSIQELEKNKSDLVETIDRFAFNCVSKCLLGVEIPNEYISVYHDISDKSANLPHLIFSEKEKENYKILKLYVEKNISKKTNENNLLQHMIDSSMTKKQLIDEIITILGTGFETTSALICWSILNITQNKHILEDVRKEKPLWVDNEKISSYDEIFKSQTINNIIKETLRTNPPVYFTTRTAESDFMMNNVKIENKSNIFISQYVSHRNEKIFLDSNKWNPNRWLNNYEKNLPNGSYFPFGIGSRKCVGEHFAKLMATIFLSIFLNKYDFDLIGKYPDAEYLISMIPKKPVNLQIKKTT